MNQQTMVQTSSTEQPTSPNLVRYGYEPYMIPLPADKSEAREVWSNLKKMLDPLFGSQSDHPMDRKSGPHNPIHEDLSSPEG